MTENYLPYENREEHDFVNKLSVQMSKIYFELSATKKVIDEYLEATRQRRRKEDGKVTA